MPAQHVRAVLARLGADLPPRAPLVLCAKGIERDRLLLPAEIAAALQPGRPLAVLSGPSFAAEVARGLPTAVTLAAATLRSLGFMRAAALDGGLKTWRESGYPIEV